MDLIWINLKHFSKMSKLEVEVISQKISMELYKKLLINNVSNGKTIQEYCYILLMLLVIIKTTLNFILIRMIMKIIKQVWIMRKSSKTLKEKELIIISLQYAIKMMEKFVHNKWQLYLIRFGKDLINRKLYLTYLKMRYLK